MKGKRQISQRVRKFRKEHYPNQKALADALGLGQTVVSAWERGDSVPSSEAWMKIGNLAPYPENIEFWKQAGMDVGAMRAAADKMILDRVSGAKRLLDVGAAILVPRYRETMQGREEAGPAVPLPAEFIPNPGSTICLVVDRKALPVVDSPLAVFILDESEKQSRNLRPFWGQVVFARYRPENVAAPREYSGGIYMGRVRASFDFQATPDWKFRGGAFLSLLDSPERNRQQAIGLFEYSALRDLEGLDPFDPNIAADPRVHSAQMEARKMLFEKTELMAGWSIMGRMLGRLKLEGVQNEPGSDRL